MARRKVELSLIPNASSRKITFKKRRKGLLKKVSELSTLCGVEACAILFDPFDEKLDCWPPDPREAASVLSRFHAAPEMEKSRKMLSQEAYVRDMIDKVQDQRKKLARETYDVEQLLLVQQCLLGTDLSGLSAEVAGNLIWTINTRMESISSRIGGDPEAQALVNDPHINSNHHHTNGSYELGVESGFMGREELLMGNDVQGLNGEANYDMLNQLGLEIYPSTVYQAQEEMM